jgi:hypothetical protein
MMNQETPNQETVNQETVNQETVNQETPNQETPNPEPAQETPPVQQVKPKRKPRARKTAAEAKEQREAKKKENEAKQKEIEKANLFFLNTSFTVLLSKLDNTFLRLSDEEKKSLSFQFEQVAIYNEWHKETLNPNYIFAGSVMTIFGTKYIKHKKQKKNIQETTNQETDQEAQEELNNAN